MYLWFKEFLIGLTYCFVSSAALAGQQTAKLNMQIELLPSCVVNNQIVQDGLAGLNFGQLDFGETTATFNGVINTNLSNGVSSGLTIQCSGSSSTKITFGTGQYDNKVPSAFATNYFRAVSNGQDFLAYNLLYGVNREVLPPNKSITLVNNGQAQILNLMGQIINNGRAVSLGNYNDTIPVTIEF